MTQAEYAIGLMTGTVLDGNIDIAALRTDGRTIEAFGPWELSPYPPGIMPLLREAMDAAARWDFSGPEPAIFARAEAALTSAQADAVASFLRTHDLEASSVRAVGFHGQTVLHRGPTASLPGRTRQLGDGPAMAARLGIDVIYDFRSADVAAGGQGAPLAPSYHVALLQRLGAGPDTAVLNLGGVANLTCWDGAGTPYAFDTGPANAPLNDWLRRHGLGEMDRDGELAARGQVDRQRLSLLLRHPYFDLPFPKSLDRNSFTDAMADGLGVEDGAATLTAFTAGAVARGLDILPVRPRRLVACGGGRRNPSLMAALVRHTGCEVVPAEAVGWRGDAIEAECFAYLAMRSLAGLPLSYPTTTGTRTPLTGGRLARATHAEPAARASLTGG
jgi:anhydro-N-acetylmuramic acid kinase